MNVKPIGQVPPLKTFQINEWTIDPGRTYENPYDPDQIAIDATFTGPGARELTVPGFWSAECEPRIERDGTERWVQSGPGHWLIRACLPEAGEWTLRVAARDKDGTPRSDSLSIHVGPSDSPGFIRRSAANDNYLQFDSGKPYFAVGLNIGWPTRRGTADDVTWFSHLAAAGGNFARVWLCWNRNPIETKATGPGRYDLAACAYFDRMLQIAAENHIVCMLTFLNHVELLDDATYWGHGDWPLHPYNAANGGPATRPANFFDRGPARDLFKRRLRYMVARWGAYTNVFAWELWNEQDEAKVKIPLDWTREMAAELHRIDPYHHLVTTSFATVADKETWSLPEIDLTQAHLYGDAGSLHDTVAGYVRAARANSGFGKPFLLAEYGIAWQGSDAKYDPAGRGTNLHNGLWAGAMTGGFGGGCVWWWDNYVEPNDLWREYAGLAHFASDVDWPHRRFEPLPARRPRFPATQPVAWTDLQIPATGGWGRADPTPLTIDPEVELANGLPGMLFGPAKRDLRVPTVLKVDVPNDCQLIVRAAKVSEFSKLRITVDGKSTVYFDFDARPEGKQHAGAKQDPRYHNWVAKFDLPCTIDLTPGKHEIMLDNVAGDWLRLSSLTLTRSRSSLVSNVRPLVLQDHATGQTLAWLQDVDSNWYADGKGLTPRTYDDLSWAIPVPRPGTYHVEWWDPRAGRIVRSDTIAADGGELTVRPPPFSRDIALRAGPIRQ